MRCRLGSAYNPEQIENPPCGRRVSESTETRVGGLCGPFPGMRGISSEAACLPKLPYGVPLLPLSTEPLGNEGLLCILGSDRKIACQIPNQWKTFTFS